MQLSLINPHIRAALESVAFQTEDVISAMNADMEAFYGDGERGKIALLKVDGGASNNNLLMQMQSDFSGICVQSSSNPEATAAGAAFLAGLGVGFFESREEITGLLTVRERFEPQITEDERKAGLDGWRRAVAACRKFSESEE